VESLGDEVRRELGRFGPSERGMTEVLAAWPEAVGPEIARFAWPARIARDGTLHVHTADSIWAFELGHRAVEIAGRLGVTAVRFAAGPLPEHAVEPEHQRPEAVVQPSDVDVERASAIAATVDDEELRERIARAAALSLAKGSDSRSV
jgi:hypothetical protein